MQTGVVADRRPEEELVLLRSGFCLEERQRWSPSWQPPSSVVLDNDGFMMTWYQDGTDADEALPLTAAGAAQ